MREGREGGEERGGREAAHQEEEARRVLSLDAIQEICYTGLAYTNEPNDSRLCC